ncbi:hypothetical protein LOK49_LG02G00758 [Camellia lanceoleosa]|uniref:Uncharacterized protein n=1 Tax=Camellia lanceoleosa TaxID=1840588 RepID=A0ACC0ISW4_9ERIC|nr:hypothetical protein LOK49_LG02G00758 [Camellia lanceoleosa]
MEALTISLSVPTANEVDSAILGCTSFLLSDAGSKVGSLPLISSVDAVEGMTFTKAFELMNTVKPIQALVKSLVTKPQMWDVFINSDEVKAFRRQLQTGAKGPEAITSSNPPTQGISYSQQQLSGANNIVRNPSISPQMHNTFCCQQQSSGTSDGESDRSLNARSLQLNITAQQESLQPGLWEKILLEFSKIGKTIFMAFQLLFQEYEGGGGCGAGGGEQTSDVYLHVAFLLSIVLMLGIQLIRFFIMGR